MRYIVRTWESFQFDECYCVRILSAGKIILPDLSFFSRFCSVRREEAQEWLCRREERGWCSGITGEMAKKLSPKSLNRHWTSETIHLRRDERTIYLHNSFKIKRDLDVFWGLFNFGYATEKENKYQFIVKPTYCTILPASVLMSLSPSRLAKIKVRYGIN